MRSCPDTDIVPKFYSPLLHRAIFGSSTLQHLWYKKLKIRTGIKLCIEAVNCHIC